MSVRRAALAVALACNPPASGEPAPAPPVEAAPPEPTCEEPPTGALALLPSPAPLKRLKDMPDWTCPWVLYAASGELLVRPLGRGEAAPQLRAPLPVVPPADCSPCRYTGLITSLGPVLLATRRSGDSELAAAAWIGAAAPNIDLEPPAAVVFAPLWFGQHVFGDSTLQGPAWALAPHLCGELLVLMPEPRLPGAEAEEPDAALVGAAGVYVAAGPELTRHDTPVPSDMSGCTRVALELP